MILAEGVVSIRSSLTTYMFRQATHTWSDCSDQSCEQHCVGDLHLACPLLLVDVRESVKSELRSMW